MIAEKYPLWLWPNLLSLDAPVVSVLWQGFIAACFDVALAWPARVTLALAVWAVYITDRLLDTTDESCSALAPRHRFHRQHRKFMTVVLGIAVTLAVAISVIQVRPVLFRAGLLTVVAVLFYLALVHRPKALPRLGRLRWVSKEAAVAFLFTGGTMLAPWLRSDSKGGLLVAGTALFFICWANISLIEMFEWHRLRQGQGTPPHRSTIAMVDHYGIFTFSLACCLIALVIRFPGRGLQHVLLAALIAALGLYVLACVQRRLSPAAFRVLADTALLSPIPVWLLLRR